MGGNGSHTLRSVLDSNQERRNGANPAESQRFKVNANHMCGRHRISMKLLTCGA